MNNNNTHHFSVNLTNEQVENLSGSIFKPNTAMVLESIQHQIQEQISLVMSDEDFYIQKYHNLQGVLFPETH